MDPFAFLTSLSLSCPWRGHCKKGLVPLRIMLPPLTLRDKCSPSFPSVHLPIRPSHAIPSSSPLFPVVHLFASVIVPTAAGNFVKWPSIHLSQCSVTEEICLYDLPIFFSPPHATQSYLVQEAINLGSNVGRMNNILSSSMVAIIETVPSVGILLLSRAIIGLFCCLPLAVIPEQASYLYHAPKSILHVCICAYVRVA